MLTLYNIYICKYVNVVSLTAPPEPTANVAFTVNTASPELTFKCEVATSAGDKQAYRVRWFVEEDMAQEMSLGASKSVELQASNIKQDISLKKVHSVLLSRLSPSLSLPSLNLPLHIFLSLCFFPCISVLFPGLLSPSLPGP